METINQVIKRQASEVATPTPTQLLTYYQSTEATEKFLVKYNPDCRPEILQRLDLAVVASQDNPRLSKVDEIYGNGVTHDWLFTHIATAFADCGFDYQTSVEHAVSQAVGQLHNGYRALRLYEVMHFLQKFKSGYYGVMSRVFNIQQFGKALREFFIERNIEIDKELQAKRQAEREASYKRAVSRAEYERMVANGEI